MVKKQEAISYNDLQAELRAIVADMQSGELEVDKAIASYERGMEIIGILETYLKTAENKVQEIKRKYNIDSGNE